MDQEQNSSSLELLPSNIQPQTLAYRPNGLIMGNIGSGKTTLLNMLCSTSYETSEEGGDSVTRELFREPVAHGDHAFRVVDTPGLNGEEAVYKHSFLLKSALEAMPYNSIFVVMPYAARGPIMKREFLDVTRFVKKYQENIVLMLSHLDHTNSKNRTKIKRNVDNLRTQISVRNIIMYGKESSRAELANAMYACMSNSPKIRIDVTDEEFFLKFKTYSASDTTEAWVGFNEKSDDLLQEYLREIQSLSLSEETNDLEWHNIIQAMGLSLSDELDEAITNFEQAHGITMVHFDDFTAYIEMKKKKIQILDDFTDKVSKTTKWEALDSTDIRTQIKQCPRCDQFLVKTEGCDGMTNCGNVPKKYDAPQASTRPWYKYMVQRVNGRLQVRRNESEYFLPKKASSSNVDVFVASQLKQGAELGLAGCGREFEWSNLPYLSGQTLVNVTKELNSTKEQAIKNAAIATQKTVKPRSTEEEMGTTNQRFTELRVDYEGTIDTTIKSEKEAAGQQLEQEGMQTKALDIAKNMLSTLHLDVETVAQATGLSREELMKLQIEMNQ